MSPSAKDIIASAVELSHEDQASVAHALFTSLMESDLGPEEPDRTVDSAWRDEIARRIAELKSGAVQTIPAAEAERMIRDGQRPKL